jgi:hypothetical protein
VTEFTDHRPLDTTRPIRVFGWMADQQGCGAYRLAIPFEALEKTGRWEGQWDPKLTGYNWRWADIVVAQRTWLPNCTEVWQKVARASERPKLVFEIDDDLFGAIDPRNPAASTYGNPMVQHNMRINIEVADLVTVSTDRLAEVVAPLNPNVHVLPNCIPGWMLDLPDRRRTDGTVTLGWQGSPTHAADWHGIAGNVAKYIRAATGRGKRIELHTIGADGPYLPQVPTHRHTGWFDSADDAWRAVDWHVGLAPLRDHPFNWAKSDLRLLEIAARGIPAVASNVGPYAASLRHGETGYLVQHGQQWPGYLRELVDHPGERDRMGANAREWARTRTIDPNIHLWEKAYRG